MNDDIEGIRLEIAKEGVKDKLLNLEEKSEAMERAEDKVLNLEEVRVGRRFASGASGRLYLGEYRGENIALKMSRKPRSEQDGKKLELEFEQEVSLLNSVDHPNIVKLIGACRTSNGWCLATEYLSGGNLKHFLTRRTETVSWTMVCDFALDIASAMEYLHSKNIIHRDLKAENVVFTGDGILKLTDFGISRKADDNGDMTAEVGTFRWMAPEMINSERYTEKIDVYSFGIVLWEIATGERPFSDMTPMQVAFAVVSKNKRPPVPEEIIGSLGELMEKCWDTDPRKRPTFTEILDILKQAKRELLSCPESFSTYRVMMSERSSFCDKIVLMESLKNDLKVQEPSERCCKIM